MSRKLMRVPMDFKWPLNKVWDGYLNPHVVEKCRACRGCGYSPLAALFHDQWYNAPYYTGDDRGEAMRPFVPFDPVEYGAEPLRIDDPHFVEVTKRKIAWSAELNGYDWYARHGGLEVELRRMHAMWSQQWSHHLIQADVDALLAADRLWDFTRNARDGGQALVRAVRMGFHDTNSWLPESNRYRPTAAEVNRWSMSGMAHDSINSWICISARCKREGVFTNCAWCDGTGEYWSSDDARAVHDSWEPTEPPTGPGFQLWEDCSEGSPVSPVFASLDELCEYAETNCTTFGTTNFVSRYRWKEMLEDDHVYHQEGNNIFI